MAFPRFVPVLATFCLCLSGAAAAQQLSTHRPPPPAVDNDFVQQQFGSTCSLIAMSPMMADMDGDGVEDIVIPARCTNPMMDQAENNFVVVDPYYSYFGYGNPKITTQFASDNPDHRGFVLLVIHGEGEREWRSSTPKAKLMLINVPYKIARVKKLVVKKRSQMAIYVEETSGDQMTSVLYWDGKKYRYEPLGSSME